MPVMLNLSNGRMLPASEQEALRNVARSNQSDVLLLEAGVFDFIIFHLWTDLVWNPFRAVFWSALGSGVSVSSLTVWRNSSMEGTLFAGVQSVYGANG